jgi:threonylcarbamoyladenosine tRNA methylthiotransferase MtaB
VFIFWRDFIIWEDMEQRISFYTLGCRLNQAETAILQQSFEDKGYQVVDFKEPADVVVVNTCTVTENGDADTRKIVNKINRKNPRVQIALVGCQAQIQREKLLDMPNVNWVVGNSCKMELANLLSENFHINTPQVITPAIPRSSFKISTTGIDKKHTRANLKVQDGCDFFCSFCIIPFARGRARSREFDDILKDARALLAAGHREIVITGINVGTYQYQNKNFVDVLLRLVELEGLDRLRISSIEPTTVSPEVIELAAENEKICKYFHIPLQSGSNVILKSMNRKYNIEEYCEFLYLISEKNPGICLGTDVIVGFPGENDEHFEQTYHLLENLPFAYFHVFSYSERPWAKSRKLGRQVPKEIVQHRSRQLRMLSAQKRNKFMKKQIGTIQKVLFEQEKKGYWMGLTDTYIRVKVKSNRKLHNQIFPVSLEKIENNAMYGKLHEDKIF